MARRAAPAVVVGVITVVILLLAFLPSTTGGPDARTPIARPEACRDVTC
jgi:hypothetical protein